jgi:hypothetical protein
MNLSKAIGGYFELELPPKKPFLYSQAYQFQSARAAFLALLRTGKPKRVSMPRYICDAMLMPLRNEDVECVFYSINEQFDIVDDIKLSTDDWLLYVNYFGICAKNVDRILSKFNPNQIVLDHSQAFYAPPRKCLATIYSPRKFFGIPDGGLLVTNLPVVMPSKIDNGSLGRSTHLLKRLADSAESGYMDYQQADASLQDIEPLRMSYLTQNLLSSVNFQKIRKKRNDNFLFLHNQLGKLNKLIIDVSSVDGPLCYPFVIDQSGIRERLIAKRIFVPTYWHDTLKIVSDDSCEALLVRNVIPLPCDQRYGSDEMNEIARVILSNGEKR